MDTIGIKQVELLSATSPQWRLTVEGRLDTGASRTSIDIALAKTLRLQFVDKITIRNAHGKEKRKLVDLELVIDGVTHTVKASITDREGLSVPLIIGRDVLWE